jgi:nucleotidyltransferase substrate binding protein (TIGR01987 family)
MHESPPYLKSRRRTELTLVRVVRGADRTSQDLGRSILAWCEQRRSLWSDDMSEDTRWKQRLQNFDRAYILLREALAGGPGALNTLEKEGTIQRFEFAFELAWKTMKDYLEANGVSFVTVTPNQVFKGAFSAKLVDDGQVWIDMLHHRNLLSHTYDSGNFETAIVAIHDRYLPAFAALYGFFLRASQE